MRSLFGISTGLALSGTAAIIVLAYAIRFSPPRSEPSRLVLARSRAISTPRRARLAPSRSSGALWTVHLPLLRPSLGAAALLVFVDSMKELPATLLLRPFNFDTLATQVCALASLYRYEEAGLSALTIVVTSLAPLLVLHGLIVAGCYPGASAARKCRIERQFLPSFALDKSGTFGAAGSLSWRIRAKTHWVRDGVAESTCVAAQKEQVAVVSV